jgi:SAM-dependent methyltransferase
LRPRPDGSPPARYGLDSAVVNTYHVVAALDPRSPAEIRRHYEIEVELAARLRNATRDERRTLYASLYDELFRRVQTHPQLMHKAHGSSPTTLQLRHLDRYLAHDSVFLEVGAGDCALSRAVAARVIKAYAIDVSTEITSTVPRHPNLEIIVTDGLTLPVDDGSVTVAYSTQVLEHLHPDDAFDHLRQVYTALAPDGRYICITPNRLTGPHDISKYFDVVAKGFHLREYTLVELGNMMREAGFERVEAWTTRKGTSLRIPWALVRTTERAVGMLPHHLGRSIGKALPVRIVLDGYVVGVK